MQTDWSLSSRVSENSELILWILDDGNVPTDKLTNFFNKTAKVSASWNIYFIKVRKLETGHMRNWKIFIFTFFLSLSFFLNSKTFVVFCFVGRLWTGSHWRLLYSLNGSVAWIPTDSISFEFPDTGSKFDNSPFYFDTSCNKILCFSCCKSTLNEWINFDFSNFS